MSAAKKKKSKTALDMMPECDFRKGARGKYAKRYAAGGNSSQQSDTEDRNHLSTEESKELERLVRDARNPVRYMLVSEFSPRFILYYNVAEDVFAMNKPIGGTLFKRREAAELVKKLLGKGVSIVKYSAKGRKLERLSPYPYRSIKRRRTNA